MINKLKNILKKDKVFLMMALIIAALDSCVPTRDLKAESTKIPSSYQNQSTDTLNTATVKWNDFFSDPYLSVLIDSALMNNQELNIMLQQVDMAQNEIKARRGEYLPFVDIYGGVEIEKVGEYTRNGSVEHNLEIREDKRFPEPLPNFSVGLGASWELDVWKKLRNSKKSAVLEYLASVEGKNFMVTNLVSEIAASYYELVALDNQLAILDQNLEIQQNALKMVRLQKRAAKVTELAVRRFEAEVFKNQSHRFEIQQQIVETESKINFLIGRPPQSIKRNSDGFIFMLGIRAGVGLEAFNPKYLTSIPESLLYSLVGDIVGPLINRNAIKAEYQNANNRQLQAVYEYEKAILNGYIEVANQLSNIDNLKSNYELKANQVRALTESIEISLQLFRSARADYMEVLLVQREALESKIELIETKKEQMGARIKMYQALGGGWN